MQAGGRLCRRRSDRALPRSDERLSSTATSARHSARADLEDHPAGVAVTIDLGAGRWSVLGGRLQLTTPVELD